jgi:hypothetical protein
MKRKLQQKEQMLIEKEKQLTELKAEKWEKDKEQRQKISAIQKDNMERFKLIQVNYFCMKPGPVRNHKADTQSWCFLDLWGEL